MAFEQRDNSGVLFKNDKKGNEKAPDYTGMGMVDGFEYKFAAWIKEGKKGKFMSVNFQRKDEEKPKSSKPQESKPHFEEFDESLPF
jgi:hypothetical protein